MTVRSGAQFLCAKKVEMAGITAAGGAGEEPFESLVVERGAIRAIPSSTIERAEKEGGYLGKGGTGSAKWILVRGRQMVYKAGPPGNVVNEYIAYQLLAVLGARVPASYLVVNVPAGNIPMAVLTEYLPGAITAKEFFERVGIGKRTELKLAIQSEFLYHALLINWDAKNWENHMVVPLPKRGENEEVEYDIYHPYSIDPGGALFYKAMGDPKRKSDLSPYEIPEFTQMPAMSPKTQGKFYAELVDPGALHATVCRRAATINDDEVNATVESLRPLFGFLPKGADLPTLISFRLAYLRAFCAGAIIPSRINVLAAHSEYLGLNKPMSTEGVIEPMEQSIARIRYGAKVASLAEEAKEGVRMRGKRNVLEPTANLTNENFSNFQVHTLPVIRERRHAGVDKYGVEYNSNTESNNSFDNANWEPPGLYPVHRYTIKPSASEKVRQSVLAAYEDPEIDAWLREQVAFINELSSREQDILKSYTRNGDVLVNNYLRGTLYEDSRDLVAASLRIPVDMYDRPIALGYSVLDQLSSILKRKDIVVFGRLKKKDDFLLYSGELNTFEMREFMMANLDYFGQAIHLGPLIEQYRRELTAILEKAPRPPHAFRVYRGLNSESHLTSLTFRNVDFLSTSMSPEWATLLFTRTLDGALVSRKHRCCMYELNVDPDVPCLYMQSLSQYPDEYEMLIAPGMTVSMEPTARLKSVIEREGTTLTMEALKTQLRKHASKIAVVEGTVQKAKPVATRKGGIQVEEEGSFEEMATKMVHTRKNTRKAAKKHAAVEERFAQQKPRGEIKGRDRTRRVNVNWKLNRNRSKRASRNATNYSNTAWSNPSNST